MDQINYPVPDVRCPRCGGSATVQDLDHWRCDPEPFSNRPEKGRGCGLIFQAPMDDGELFLGFWLSSPRATQFWREGVLEPNRLEARALEKAGAKDLDLIWTNPGKAIRTHTSITYARLMERRLRGTKSSHRGYPLGTIERPRSLNMLGRDVQYREILDLVYVERRGLMACRYVKSRFPTLMRIPEEVLVPSGNDLKDRFRAHGPFGPKP